MNKIYWDRDKISIITNQIEAIPHKHWAMQLFLSVEKNLEINVDGQKISCRCMVINHNTLHSFSTGNRLHFTMIIEPATGFARQFNETMKGKKYHVFDNPDIDESQRLLLRLIENGGINEYRDFMMQLYKFLSLKEQTGIPLKSYLQFHQMKSAFGALSDGKNITEASMIAYFDTPSHFAAVTKRMMGMSAGISLKDSVF